MPYCKMRNQSQMHKMIDLVSTSVRIHYRLDNKPKQKYGLFAKFLLSVIGACKVAKNPHIFLTRENQHCQEINRQFDGTLYNFGPMLFAANQEQNKSYTFKVIFLQPYKYDLILSVIKEVAEHEARNYWPLMKKSEVNNKRKN